MALALAAAGHETECFPDARAAMRIQEQRPADLLITDIFMPGTDGLEAIVAFRSRWPTLPIVAISGGGSIARGDYLDVAKEIGADAMLRKPFEPEQLLGVVARLGRRRA
jgi:DNA-binding response OmpR family regulator